MKILLVEDSQRKADRIASFLDLTFGAEVSLARSYRSALAEMQRTSFDVVLLDMSLPTFDPSARERFGRPRPLGGREIMAKMIRKKIPGRVIIVTQLDRFGVGDEEYSFQQVKEICMAEYPSLFAGAVFFSQSDNRWESELRDQIGKAVGQ